jgi:predicted RNase H-like HicB family nuclease
MTTVIPMTQEALVPACQVFGDSWVVPSPPAHEFTAIACPEEEGGYSIFAADYPGIVSQGDTLEEAKTNIAEAFMAMLEARRNHGEPLAHSRDAGVERSAGCVRLRIRVNG